ncbi:MAG: hypothetical protein HKN46_09490 [Acidimicrobiia bacterium]|nr:hypothetical protein [Acidimicrobiia bacterium]
MSLAEDILALLEVGKVELCWGIASDGTGRSLVLAVKRDAAAFSEVEIYESGAIDFEDLLGISVSGLRKVTDKRWKQGGPS